MFRRVDRQIDRRSDDIVILIDLVVVQSIKLNSKDSVCMCV